LYEVWWTWDDGGRTSNIVEMSADKAARAERWLEEVLPDVDTGLDPSDGERGVELLAPVSFAEWVDGLADGLLVGEDEVDLSILKE
jgi:hypothetical protein